jgi:hypothetical protein
MHDGSQIGEKVGDPEITELGLAERGDAGSEEISAHGRRTFLNTLMRVFSQVALAPSTPE